MQDDFPQAILKFNTQITMCINYPRNMYTPSGFSIYNYTDVCDTESLIHISVKFSNFTWWWLWVDHWKENISAQLNPRWWFNIKEEQFFCEFHFRKITGVWIFYWVKINQLSLEIQDGSNDIVNISRLLKRDPCEFWSTVVNRTKHTYTSSQVVL